VASSKQELSAMILVHSHCIHVPVLLGVSLQCAACGTAIKVETHLFMPLILHATQENCGYNVSSFCIYWLLWYPQSMFSQSSRKRHGRDTSLGDVGHFLKPHNQHVLNLLVSKQQQKRSRRSFLDDEDSN